MRGGSLGRLLGLATAQALMEQGNFFARLQDLSVRLGELLAQGKQSRLITAGRWEGEGIIPAQSRRLWRNGERQVNTFRSSSTWPS